MNGIAESGDVGDRGSGIASKSGGSETTSRDRLALLGIRGTKAELLRYLTLHPDEPVHLRQLEQLFGPRSASFQRDLKALTELGALRRRPPCGGAAKRRVEYELVHEWSLWPAVRSLIGQLSDPVDLLRDAFRGLAGVDAAFIYGSFAYGSPTPVSDVDVFVVGKRIDTRAMHRALFAVSLLVGRQVNPNVFTPIRLAEGLGLLHSPSRRFLSDVIGGPKRWICGAADALRPIAAAAGISLPPYGDAPGVCTLSRI